MLSTWKLGLAISLLSPVLIAQQPKVLAPHDPIAPKVTKLVPQTPVPGSTSAGPWIVDSHFQSNIYLKNIVETSAITVTPVLHLSDGTTHRLSSVQLEPSGIANIDVNASLESLGIVPNATLSGWVELQYNWAWDPICAMIRVLDVTRSLIFTFGFEPPMSMMPQSQHISAEQVTEGMWWKQEPNVTGFVALANTTSKAITATVDVSDTHASILGSHTVTVPPQGMEMLNLLEMQSASSLQGGIRVSYTGEQDALLISGALEDVGNGYDANIPFAPPAHPIPPMAKAAVPQGIVELGLMAGAADPYMHFPDGTVFTPYSVMRNISTAPLSVTPTLWWMQGTAPKSFQLPSFRLLPFETRTIDVPSMLAAAGLKDFSGYANLAFDTQSQTGLLLASGSVDQTYNYSFPVVPRGILPSASKSIAYWSTGNGDDTMVTMWNPADEVQNFTFRLVYAGGHYDRLITLGPRATYMFDISEIMAPPGPDLDGNVIPAGTHEGSAEIVGIEADNESILLAVDSAVYNVRKATCQQNCTSCNGTTSYWVASSPFGVAVGGQTQEYLQAQWNTGQQYDYTSGASWSSSNTSVATISQPGMAQGVSAGSFTAGASISNVPVYAQACNGYPPCPVAGGGGGQAPGNAAPTITSISPAQGLVGTAINVTINGTGFASGATVNAGSNITVSNTQVTSSTKITATFTPTNSVAAGGSQGVTVTVNEQRSTSQNFFVQYPKHIAYISERNTPNNGHSAIVSGTDINIVTIGGTTLTSGVCGGYQWLTYELTDQQGNQITNGNVIFSESFSNISPSPDPLGGASPGPPFTLNLATGVLGDTYAIYVSSPPGACLSPNASDSFNQYWTPNVGGTISGGIISGGVTYPLSTVISASQSTNSQGLPTFSVSISTP